MFSVILIILGMVLFFFLINIAMQPPEFAIMRAAVIFAPQSQIFTNVNDLHLWKAWSPWARLDAQAKEKYAGPDKGKGAAMSWDGNSKIGSGTMTITESRPEEYIKLRLDFKRPMQATNTTEFSFVSLESGGVQVTWLMTGQNNFIGKIMYRVMNCDQMVGRQFEDGLANLAAIVTPAA